MLKTGAPEFQPRLKRQAAVEPKEQNTVVGVPEEDLIFILFNL